MAFDGARIDDSGSDVLGPWGVAARLRESRGVDFLNLRWFYLGVVRKWKSSYVESKLGQCVFPTPEVNGAVLPLHPGEMGCVRMFCCNLRQAPGYHQETDVDTMRIESCHSSLREKSFHFVSFVA